MTLSSMYNTMMPVVRSCRKYTSDLRCLVEFAYQSFFLMSEYAQAYLAITARGVALCSFRIFFAACAMAE